MQAPVRKPRKSKMSRIRALTPEKLRRRGRAKWGDCWIYHDLFDVLDFISEVACKTFWWLHLLTILRWRKSHAKSTSVLWLASWFCLLCWHRASTCHLLWLCHLPTTWWLGEWLSPWLLWQRESLSQWRSSNYPLPARRSHRKWRLHAKLYAKFSQWLTHHTSAGCQHRKSIWVGRAT